MQSKSPRNYQRDERKNGPHLKGIKGIMYTTRITGRFLIDTLDLRVIINPHESCNS
jgi:hypothetical protein